MLTPFFDPHKSYEENYFQGPFGEFTSDSIYVNKTSPEYLILGNKVHLPFGIPAGPLLNGKYCRAALDKGFDIVIYKTVRSKKHACNPWPNVLSLDINEQLDLDTATKGLIGDEDYGRKRLSITNSFGVPSMDPDVWQPDLKKTNAYAKEGQVVIGSFQGTLSGNRTEYIHDFARTASLMKETGVPILEVNLSCPNEGTTQLLCFDVETTKVIIDAIKNKIGNTPLVVKISYYQNDALLAAFVRDIGPLVEGIAAINTIPAKIYGKDGKQALPGEKRLTSGVCGYAIKWAGLEMVQKLKKLRETSGFSFTIFGGGGVTIAEDFAEYRKAGADVVMSATGAMWNPYLAQEIKAINLTK